MRKSRISCITRSAWSVYSKFAEDKTSFLLYVQESESFLPIPKGELTLIQIHELHALLEARLPHD